MPLTLFFSKPRDLVEKLRRDKARLEVALGARDILQIADCIFDFANTGYCIKDWLKENANSAYSGEDVEAHVRAHSVLGACRDICNANKHYQVTRYVPKTQDVYVSATGVSTLAVQERAAGLPLESGSTPDFKVKILMKDRTKFDAGAFAKQVVDVWKAFFTKHGL